MTDRSRVREEARSAIEMYDDGWPLDAQRLIPAVRLVADPSTIILTGEKCETCKEVFPGNCTCMEDGPPCPHPDGLCPSCHGSGTTWEGLREKMIPSMAEAIAGDRAEEITEEHAADAAAAFDAVLAVLTEEGT